MKDSNNFLKKEFQKHFYYLEGEEWKEDLPDFDLITSDNISKNPKISVIIANYNNSSYLERMFQSLINQTLALNRIQILFIDDKSTDNSLKIALEYVENYDSLEIYSLKENTGGAHGPRNIGILNARGEYVVFLDADDWYDKEAFSYMTGLLDDSKDDMAFTGMMQSINGRLSLKSKPYFFEGEKYNRSIEELSAEFYGWLGPQAIILRRSLLIENNMHFIKQKVADDVTFFYQAMRLSKTITQGTELTTYLNRDEDNEGLSKRVNRDFMISWLRALGYINRTYPDDVSKQRFLARRLEWLVYDFCLRRDIGYKFGVERLRDFKDSMLNYLGEISFNPSDYFRTDARKVAWKYLMKEDYKGLICFNNWHGLRHVLKNKFNLFYRKENIYYFPVLKKSIPLIRINVRAIARKYVDNKILVSIYTDEHVNYFEMRNVSNPYERRKLHSERVSFQEYSIDIPEDFNNELWRVLVISDRWHEHGIENFSKVIKNNDIKN